MVKIKIEELREILYRVIQDKNDTDYDKVLQISQDMDKYIYAYVKKDTLMVESLTLSFSRPGTNGKK